MDIKEKTLLEKILPHKGQNFEENGKSYYWTSGEGLEAPENYPGCMCM